MGTKMQSFTNRVQGSMGKFASNKLLSAISNGMIRLLPVTMVGSVCAILGNLGFPGYQDFVNKIGFGPIFAMGVQMTTNLISIYVLISLAYEYSKKLDGSKVNSILLSVMSFFLLTPIGNIKIKGTEIVSLDLSYLGSKGMFVAMIVSLSVTYLYCLLERKHITIKMPDSVPPAVSNSFTGLVPAWIIAGIVLIINGILRATSFGDIHDLIYTIVQTPLEHLGGSIWALLFILFFSEFLWFFGIHGSMATSAIIYTLYQPLELQNLAAFTAGQPLPNILTKTFIDVMKGPRHFALAILLLFICRSHHMKSVGKVAIVPAFFGISEPMKFGIPMVLNPILFIPMTLSPVISVGLAYAATSLKLIPRMTGITFPWNIPVIFGLVVGDWRTAVFQIIQLLLAMALYYPFIKFLDKQSLEQEADQVEKE